ncbi:MAG TPA: 3-hydroxyacyl-CoA dehydrogenase NAD-binding domain-containing protein [Pirellulales bacterium]|nr:3-hydroxyacyl-CoA dehydrogenase NAD-binding domain-containing protein [Pirellulales bacterium]
MSEVVHLERRGDVALITIDSPPVNSLSTPVVEGIFSRVAEANKDAGIRAMVITGARDNFIAGADITGLQALAEGKGKVDSQNIGALTGKLEELEANAKPVVMAIDGFALGGGLEVAMAGHWRVGTTRCRCGLPELTLGIIPGAAGTQRLPRIVGVQKATEMMLTSVEARGKEALALGIIQEMVEPERLIDAAIAAARKLADGQAKPVRASQLNDKIGTPDEARMIMEGAKAIGGDKLRNLVHPHLCMDAILTGVTDGYQAGLKREAENFAKCLASPQAAGMIHIFFATRAAPKVPGVTDQKFEPKAIKRVAVLGGGTMGSGIATSLLQSGFEVVLKEVNAEFAEAGRGRIQSNLESRVKKGKLAQDKYDQMMARLAPQIDYTGFDKVDMVIEAVIENIELKQGVFADLEKAVRPDCILASNTSTIDLDVIGEKTKAQDRILGTHFFSPAHVMPLVEVVRSKKTSPQALNSAINLVKQLKKTPVTVGNCVGFLVNRIFFPYGQTALLLVDHGVDLYRLDKAVYDWGMPMGPFRMSDLAGVDVAKFAGGILAKAYSDHNYVSTLVDHLFAAKRFGEKTGRGYYKYEGKKAEHDPELAGFIAKARADAGNPAVMEVSDKDIVEHVMFGVVNEACRCLDEGIAIRPSDIDVACVMGMGFPAYRGGVMKWADTLGAKYIYDKLAAWHKKYGPVYEPCDYLKRKAEKGESLEK